MNGNTKQLKNITLPGNLFSSMVEACQGWEKFSNDFEDFLLSLDKGFIAKMRRARKEHLAGKTRKLKNLKQELA